VFTPATAALSQEDDWWNKGVPGPERYFGVNYCLFTKIFVGYASPAQKCLETRET